MFDQPDTNTPKKDYGHHRQKLWVLAAILTAMAIVFVFAILIKMGVIFKFATTIPTTNLQWNSSQSSVSEQYANKNEAASKEIKFLNDSQINYKIYNSPALDDLSLLNPPAKTQQALGFLDDKLRFYAVKMNWDDPVAADEAFQTLEDALTLNYTAIGCSPQYSSSLRNLLFPGDSALCFISNRGLTPVYVELATHAAPKSEDVVNATVRIDAVTITYWKSDIDDMLVRDIKSEQLAKKL